MLRLWLANPSRAIRITRGHPQPPNCPAWEDGQRGYFCGIEVAENHEGPVPVGRCCERIEAGEFAVFHHPAYDFEGEDAQVFAALHAAMEAWKPGNRGFAPDDTRPTYQRHGSDTFGQVFCRPVKRA